MKNGDFIFAEQIDLSGMQIQMRVGNKFQNELEKFLILVVRAFNIMFLLPTEK